MTQKTVHFKPWKLLLFCLSLLDPVLVRWPLLAMHSLFCFYPYIQWKEHFIWNVSPKPNLSITLYGYLTKTSLCLDS